MCFVMTGHVNMKCIWISKNIFYWNKNEGVESDMCHLLVVFVSQGGAYLRIPNSWFRSHSPDLIIVISWSTKVELSNSINGSVLHHECVYIYLYNLKYIYLNFLCVLACLICASFKTYTVFSSQWYFRTSLWLSFFRKYFNILLKMLQKKFIQLSSHRYYWYYLRQNCKQISEDKLRNLPNSTIKPFKSWPNWGLNRISHIELTNVDWNLFFLA